MALASEQCRAFWSVKNPTLLRNRHLCRDAMGLYDHTTTAMHDASTPPPPPPPFPSPPPITTTKQTHLTGPGLGLRLLCPPEGTDPKMERNVSAGVGEGAEPGLFKDSPENGI